MSDRRVAWVRAQLDATEAAAKAASAPSPWVWRECTIGTKSYYSLVSGSRNDMIIPSAMSDVYPSKDNADHIALHDPAAVLADVEAKRAILERCEHEMRNYIGTGAQAATPYLIVRLLAEGFRHRPGYEEVMRGE